MDFPYGLPFLALPCRSVPTLKALCQGPAPHVFLSYDTCPQCFSCFAPLPLGKDFVCRTPPYPWFSPWLLPFFRFLARAFFLLIVCNRQAFPKLVCLICPGPRKVSWMSPGGFFFAFPVSSSSTFCFSLRCAPIPPVPPRQAVAAPPLILSVSHFSPFFFFFWTRLLNDLFFFFSFRR